MDDFSTRKPHCETTQGPSMTASKKSHGAYDMNLSFWDQPRSYYGGITAGVVFQLVLLGVILKFLGWI